MIKLVKKTSKSRDEIKWSFCSRDADNGNETGIEENLKVQKLSEAFDKGQRYRIMFKSLEQPCS